MRLDSEHAGAHDPGVDLDGLFRDDDWTEERLAAAVGADQSTLNRLRRRKRQAGLGLALRIERATAGLVRAEDVPMSRSARKDLRSLRKAMKDQEEGRATAA